MSNSAKKSPSNRSKTAQSPSSTSERKPASSIIKDIQPDAGAGQTRRQYTAEEKIRIVLEGLQSEQSVAEICRREGLNTNIYYRWIGPPKRERVPGSGKKGPAASVHFRLTTYSCPPASSSTQKLSSLAGAK